MRRIAYIISMIALAATIAPAFVFYRGSITLDQLKLTMGVAMVTWFVTAPLWMGRAPEPSTSADRSL